MTVKTGTALSVGVPKHPRGNMDFYERKALPEMVVKALPGEGDSLIQLWGRFHLHSSLKWIEIGKIQKLLTLKRRGGMPFQNNKNEKNQFLITIREYKTHSFLDAYGIL